MNLLTRLLLVSLCVTPVSCEVVSENPIGTSGPITNDRAALLGSWAVEEIAKLPTEKNITVTIESEGSDTIRALIRDATQSEVVSARLSTINGQLLASVASDSGEWSLYRLEIDPTGATLVIMGPDASVLRKDIEGGGLLGVVSPLDLDDFAVVLSASSEALRDYLGSRPDIFKEAFVKLRKAN
jgi:hypothetical protein